MKRFAGRARSTVARLTTAATVASLVTPLACATVYPGARAPAVAIHQRLGAQLPLAARFVDADGRAVRLGDYFRAGPKNPAVPVILVLGYYHCPHLCETVMEGAIQALGESGLSRRAFRIVAVSIDPSETPADAQARRRVDLQIADAATPRPPAEPAAPPLLLDTLVGDSDAITTLARQAGFVFERSGLAAGDRAGSDDTARAEFAHAAGFLVATADGRVSRYFLGVRPDPVALREAIDAAAGRSIGGLVDDLILLCAHLDPTLGRYTPSVMLGLRIGSVALAMLLGLWIWRHRRAPSRATRP